MVVQVATLSYGERIHRWTSLALARSTGPILAGPFEGTKISLREREGNGYEDCK